MLLKQFFSQPLSPISPFPATGFSDNNSLSFRLQIASEEHFLRRKIFFHAAMIVQMIPAQVSEHGNIKKKASQTPLRDGMGRSFHNHVCYAMIHHLTEKTLKLHRARCGQGRRFNNRSACPILIAIIHGPDHPDLNTRTREHLFNHPGDRGLAVGPGQTDESQGLHGKIIKSRRKPTQCL